LEMFEVATEALEVLTELATEMVLEVMEVMGTAWWRRCAAWAWA